MRLFDFAKDVGRQVINTDAEAAENTTGIDVGVIKKALPLLATLAIDAMSKNNAEPECGLGNLIGMARKFF